MSQHRRCRSSPLPCSAYGLVEAIQEYDHKACTLEKEQSMESMSSIASTSAGSCSPCSSDGEDDAPFQQPIAFRRKEVQIAQRPIVERLLVELVVGEWATALVAFSAALLGGGMPSVQGAVLRGFAFGLLVLLSLQVMEGTAACMRCCKLFAHAMHDAFLRSHGVKTADRIVAMASGTLFLSMTIIGLVLAPLFLYRVALHMSQSDSNEDEQDPMECV